MCGHFCSKSYFSKDSQLLVYLKSQNFTMEMKAFNSSAGSSVHLHGCEQSLCRQVQGCLVRLASDQAPSQMNEVLDAGSIQRAQSQALCIPCLYLRFLDLVLVLMLVLSWISAKQAHVDV